jgi:universal stress protein A
MTATGHAPGAHGGRSTETPAAAQYQRVLLVVDLTDDSRIVGARARAIAAASGAAIALLHVVEYVPVEPMGETLLPAVEIERELVKRAGERLRALAHDLGLPDAPCRVEAGNTKAEIVRVASETGADLVVIGSRERHGLSILVNLTEDTILHAAPCDVLAVRLR